MIAVNSLEYNSMSQRTKISRLLVAVIIISSCHTGTDTWANSSESISLSGQWRFRLDPENAGVDEKWFAQKLSERTTLPGSTAENGYGDDVSVKTKWTGKIIDKSWLTAAGYEKYREPGNVKVPFWLQPVKYYRGIAWYQRDIEIRPELENKQITLFLERCHWETKVWLDNQLIGTRNSLSVPHRYEFGKVAAGRHRLTISVDNSVKINVGENAHSISDHTQSNWNGIVGRMELTAADSVWITDIQVYPNVARKIAVVRMKINTESGNAVMCKLALTAESFNSEKKHRLQPINSSVDSSNVIEIEYPMGENALLWDEFSPNLYRMKATIEGKGFFDSKTVTFGMREFKTKGTQFTINGRKTFLRGTLECCIFPKTGYPSMDVEEWTRIIKVAKAHGLNHLRFHSYCPPRAAFEAADRLGCYFQVEGPFWSAVGDGGKLDKYIYAECDRILKEYGNHPSFCLMAYGNEPAEMRKSNRGRFFGDLVNHWKNSDSRHLYTSASGWPIIPESNFHSTQKPRIHHWGHELRCRINAKAPATTADYRKFISKYKAPVISHEIGQWCAYPNFEEIKKYTGVLKAKNFEIFRETLQENHMLDQAHDFLMASGKLQTLCYKEEIESALRTPGFGGFQLLDLHDFPGQGTALVGVLDPFWESKGYVTAKEYSRFCNQTVPLAKMKKRIWTANETFAAEIDIAHFGPKPLKNVKPAWSITYENGRTFASGRLSTVTIPVDNAVTLGRIEVPLTKVKSARKFVLTITVDGFSNDWDFWVYPVEVQTDVRSDIIVANRLDDKTVKVLNNGGKVLLLPAAGTVRGDRYGKVPPGFSSIFWNTAWTKRQAPHTLGILCNPVHRALAGFPTEYHSNWQWWDLVTKSQIMILNNFPAEVRPIVQVIDDWFTNRRLALVFEAKVNGGRLIVCGIDLHSNLEKRPVARQLRHSLLSYMNSSAFNPARSINLNVVQNLLK